MMMMICTVVVPPDLHPGALPLDADLVHGDVSGEAVPPLPRPRHLPHLGHTAAGLGVEVAQAEVALVTSHDNMVTSHGHKVTSHITMVTSHTGSHLDKTAGEIVFPWQSSHGSSGAQQHRHCGYYYYLK